MLEDILKRRQAAQVTPAKPRVVTKERILIGGEAKSGKTYTWLTIANHLPDAKFMLVSPDDGERRLLQFEFPQVSNVYPFFCSTWTEIKEAQETLEGMIARKELGMNDWIITEGLDIIYNNLRHEFIEAVVPLTEAKKRGERKAKELWDAILDRRARGAPVLERTDWDAIHGQLERWLAWLAFRVPCHWLATTSVSYIREEEEDKQIKLFYESLGSTIRFDGQKRVPRLFDTLIVLAKTTADYRFSVYSDRGSRWKLSENKFDPKMHYKNTDFYVDYLQKLAGWQ